MCQLLHCNILFDCYFPTSASYSPCSDVSSTIGFLDLLYVLYLSQLRKMTSLSIILSILISKNVCGIYKISANLNKELILAIQMYSKNINGTWKTSTRVRKGVFV